MRLSSSLGTFCLLLLISLGAAANRHYGGDGDRIAPISYQSVERQGWRTQVHDHLVDENEGDIQQSQNFDVEDFELPPKGSATTPKYQWQRNPKPHATSPLPPKYVEDTPRVSTDAGKFIGKKIKTGTGKTVIAFLGIPFAKPPVGDLRFKKPVKMDKLSETFDATHLPNACFQESAEVFPGFEGEKVWNPNTNVSEDCLYLNIWIPEEVFTEKEKELVPTMMWIYGGGLFSGSASLDVYNGAVLASEEQVVVVSTNYRLGPQGFLYLGTPDAPGNMGMWDQNLALRWVNEHIENFGGDPNKVTLFGESCGAASVGYHLLSPKSKIYFKRGVMTSGLPGQEYSFVDPNTLRQRTLKFAKLAGCDIKKTPAEIMECLRQVDPSTIYRLQWKFYNKMLVFPFVVTVDNDFLPDTPATLLANGDAKRTEVIMGTVQNEGSYFLLYQYLKYMRHDRPTSVSGERFLDIMKETFQDYSEAEQEAIISYYTNWKNPEDGYLNQALISEAIGDAVFTCPMRKWADDWSSRGLKVFYYHLTQRPSSSKWAEWMDVMHGDDVFFYFGHMLEDEQTYSTKERMLSSYFMRLFANFAKVGTPSDKWERYTSELPVYLELNATETSDATIPTNLGPNADRCAFWNRILPKVDKRQKTPRRQSNWNNRKNPQWNRMNSMNRPTKGQLPYPQMGWNIPQPQMSQSCGMPSQGHQGIHGGPGFHMNTMGVPQQSYNQQSTVCTPTPSFVGKPPPPEENVGQGALPAVPKNPGGTPQVPYVSSEPNCVTCCDSNPSRGPSENAEEDEDDYSESHGFFPAH